MCFLLPVIWCVHSSSPSMMGFVFWRYPVPTSGYSVNYCNIISGVGVMRHHWLQVTRSCHAGAPCQIAGLTGSNLRHIEHDEFCQWPNFLEFRPYKALVCTYGLIRDVRNWTWQPFATWTWQELLISVISFWPNIHSAGLPFAFLFHRLMASATVWQTSARPCLIGWFVIQLQLQIIVIFIWHRSQLAIAIPFLFQTLEAGLLPILVAEPWSSWLRLPFPGSGLLDWLWE